MKPKLIAALVILVLLIPFIPIPRGTLNDGGTRVYDALTYKLVRWRRLSAVPAPEGTETEPVVYRGTSVYWYPDNKKPIDDLWKLDHPSDAAVSPQTVVPSDNVIPYAKSVDFKAQCIRTDGSPDNATYPKTIWITSAQELSDYYEQNKTAYSLDFSQDGKPSFAEATESYDDLFFAENDLILVVLEEPSGSIRHKVRSLTLTPSGLNRIEYDIRPEIDRIVPEVQTDDMAEWHILIEVPKEYGMTRSQLQDPVIN